MIAPTCECGKTATGVYDISVKLSGEMMYRIPLCSSQNVAEYDGLIAARIFNPSDLELQSSIGACWCNMRNSHIVVPWCPVHGELKEGSK